MISVYNFIMSNIYLYICIILVLIILETVLLIKIINQAKRAKIKNDFVEAEKVETELEKIEDTPVHNELQNLINKMQEDINVKPEDVVRKFEQEQEEKAIISYQELLNSVSSGKIEVIDDEEANVNFVENLGVSNEEPVSEVSDEDAVTPSMVKEAILNISNDSIKDEPKKFKQSQFISPIFGVMNNNIEYPKVKKNDTTMDLMNTKDYNELTDEIKKQEEFLNALKEFRNNL